MDDEIRPMTYAAVHATTAKTEARKAANRDTGVTCANCGDTGVVPAPEPYGSWGCTWACSECDAAQKKVTDSQRTERTERTDDKITS